MNASLPDGYARRVPADDDVDQLLRLVHAYDIATIGHPDFTADDVRDELADTRIDRQRGAWVVTAPDGALVGWAQVAEQGVQADGVVATETDITVHPDAPDAVGQVLVDAAVDRVAEIVGERGATSVRVDSFVMTSDARAASWFAAAGFAPVRRFSRLEVTLTGDEKPPQLPPGVTIRVADAESDRRVVHRLLYDSFADHFGTVPEPYEVWSARTAATSTADPSQWWVIEVDSEPAGLAMGNHQWAEENGGWVKNLGVLPEYRGHGLGRMLLEHALVEMAARGRKQAGLGVDTANTSGALALYESVGFRAVHSADVWRLILVRKDR